MFQLGRDMISMTLLSTQSHMMEKVACRTVGLVLTISQITFVVLLIIIRFKCPRLTMESLKIFGSLITVNLECLCSSVSGLIEIPEYGKTKWDLL